MSGSKRATRRGISLGAETELAFMRPP